MITYILTRLCMILFTAAGTRNVTSASLQLQLKLHHISIHIIPGNIMYNSGLFNNCTQIVVTNFVLLISSLFSDCRGQNCMPNYRTILTQPLSQLNVANLKTKLGLNVCKYTCLYNYLPISCVEIYLMFV